jgi:hypothetical protein
MDFISRLPKSGNKSSIMVVFDRLSKYAYFCALQQPFTISMMAQIFMDQGLQASWHATLYCL